MEDGDLDGKKEWRNCLKPLDMKKALTSYPDQGLFYLSLLDEGDKNGGQAWIRTMEARAQQIYSLSPLATWVPTRNVWSLLNLNI